LTSCASLVSTAAGASARTPRKITLSAGSPRLDRVLTVDLRDSSMVLERAGYMPRSGRLDAAECASLADAARALPRAVTPGNCPVAKVILSSFAVAYDDGTGIAGPRCTSSPDGDSHERVLFDRLWRVAEQHVPTLESSGTTPPGECDPIECRPKTTSSYEFSSDGSHERCPDGRTMRELKDRCLRDAAGACAVHQLETRPCPR
jgi:hypothetical protein